MDTGNNNYIKTILKGNFLPYGQNFPGNVPPTGRFSNGKLVPDFLASALGIKDKVPPFLDPNLSDEELVSGVCFASAGSGWDDLTTMMTRVITADKQIDMFKDYIKRVKGIVGDEKKGMKIINDALVVISAGTNDFGYNFYGVPTRRFQYTVDRMPEDAYSWFTSDGLLPLQMTAKFQNPLDRKCLEDQNSESKAYNDKLSNLINQLQTLLPHSKIVYADIYSPLLDMIQNPKKYSNSTKLPSTILIFGDSTMDTGNNNYINTILKGNHPPYGQNFLGHIPTGRFSDGKLVPDFIASTLQIKEAVPPFLQPNLSDDELLSGVTFASAGSGWDDLTTLATRVIPLSKQIDMFRDYIRRVKRIVGDDQEKTNNIITYCNITNFPSTILIFGDSTVDTGNNNYIKTLAKGNYLPYGQDFPGHIPTGRFSNGKLVPDFIASALGIKAEAVPPFLDPNLSDDQLLSGVSFASGGSGFDDLTTLVSKAIPVSKQIKLFRDYIRRIKGIVGEEKAKKIISGSLVVISAGANDFIFSFYDIPTRRLEFSVGGYQDFLLDRLQSFVKELYELGCRKVIIAGLPPIGCLPIQITLKFENPLYRKCLEDQNSDAQSYNLKLSNLIGQLQPSLPCSRIIFADIYQPLIDMINHPHEYESGIDGNNCYGTGKTMAKTSASSARLRQHHDESAIMRRRQAID
ncbi:hypothetical protein EZV62_025318 [Acer yangbiense]|uniref:SGNH hydrolase-type esterase domain-containing protein n=1 Tax=Acer yangbiense TaxID=1000413 RepID=A0A5C7GXG3_9ROSI|nr:hypothetical protein EZV62_025318 [Acer yangbiense]